MESACGGVIITASHNPRQWNALKFLNEKGEFLPPSEASEVVRAANAEAYEFVDVDNLGCLIQNYSYDQRHIELIKQLELVDVEAIRRAHFTVALDAVNSVGGVIIPKLLGQLGVTQVTLLNCEPTGDFAHNPEPLKENLSEIRNLMRKGRHDIGFVVDPDADLTRTLLEDCQGYALSMTLAPEKPGAYGPGSVAEALIDGGALPSWGHTDSNSLKAREALVYSRERFAEVETKRGPRATITHLFNGMRPLHHRDTGPIAEFLSDAARGGAVAELICDSIHVDPTLVRDVYEMVGRDHVVFITDAMAAAGMADGAYTLGPQDVIVKDGVARLAQGNAIAGGTAHLLDCVRVAVTKGGIPLVDAVYMASVQGATILGDDTVGSLAPGKKADIVEVDAQLNVRRVLRRGTVVA